MKTLYGVTLSCFIVGMAIVCYHAPWASTLPGVTGDSSSSVGYAPIWSAHFAGNSGAQIDVAGVGIYTAVAAFFSIVIGSSAYFFRGKRGGEKDLDE